MITYRVKGYQDLPPECTLIKACQSDKGPPDGVMKWELADDNEIQGLTHLYTQDDVKFYGQL